MLTYGMGYYSSDRYIQEARRFKIKILPPDINKSKAGFTVEKGNIRSGLSRVKGLGIKYLEYILSTRKKYKIFHSLYDFCYKISPFGINQTVIENLIKVGAFDFTTYPRAALLTLLPLTLKEIKKRTEEKIQYEISQEREKDYSELIPSHSIPVCHFSIYAQMSLEKEILNLYITNYPLKKYDRILAHLPMINSAKIADSFSGKTILIKGMLIQARRQFTRQKQVMAFLLLEDEAGFFEVIVFPDIYQKYAYLFHKEKPLLVKGFLSREYDDFKIIARKIININSYRTANIQLIKHESRLENKE
jgi:DNA polymerase-3 subunit alpha